jgi:hypothetical protein
MASGKGHLFVVQEFIDPVTVTYNLEDDDITSIRIWIMMRDFDGVNDGLPNDVEPVTLSKEHHYNLRNQGWVVPGSPSVQSSTPSDPPPPSGGDPAPDPDDPEADGGSGSYYDPYTGTLPPYRRSWHTVQQ